MTALVMGPEFRSADSLLVVAAVCLVFALIGISELRELEAPARDWKRLSTWFPVVMERIDAKYKGWSISAIAIDVVKRLKAAEFELRVFRAKYRSDSLRRTVAERLTTEFADCKHCGVRVVKAGGVWIHADSWTAVCLAKGVYRAATPEVHQ